MKALNRLSIVYDTRNDLTGTNRMGTKWVAYGALPVEWWCSNRFSVHVQAGIDAVPSCRLHAKPSWRTSVFALLPTAMTQPFGRSAASAEPEAKAEASSRCAVLAGRFYDRKFLFLQLEGNKRAWEFQRGLHSCRVGSGAIRRCRPCITRWARPPVAQLHKVGGLAFAQSHGLLSSARISALADEGPAVFSGIYYPF